MRHGASGVDAPGSKRDALGVHLEQRHLRLFGEVDRCARAGAVGRRRTQRERQPVGVAAGIDRDRVRAEPPGLLSEGLRPELRGRLPSGLVGVDVRGRSRPERDGESRGVETDRSWTGAADDQHVGARLLGERRADGTPGIAEIVRGAREGRRLDAARHRHEHVLRIGNANEVGEEAAPLLHGWPEAVRGHEWDAAAVGGPARAACLACAA